MLPPTPSVPDPRSCASSSLPRATRVQHVSLTRKDSIKRVALVPSRIRTRAEPTTSSGSTTSAKSCRRSTTSSSTPTLCRSSGWPSSLLRPLRPGLVVAGALAERVGRDVLDVLPEPPLRALGIPRPVMAVAVGLSLGLLQDLGTRLLRSFEVAIDVVDVDVHRRRVRLELLR